MFFKQIKHNGDNFSYIIAGESGEAAVVDPSFNADVIIQIATNQKLNLKYIIVTHHHWDHVAGNQKIRSSLGSKVVAHRLSKVEKDIEVVDGDLIKVGKISIEVIHTPGHTPDSICLLVDNNKLLTGDTLFVGECGRTDLPGSSSKNMYNSLFFKLMKLNDKIEVYPGHDYGPRPKSTIGIEKKTNYTLEKRSLEEFIEFMKET